MLSQSALPVTLDQFLVSLDSLPKELKKNLGTMQTLDKRIQRLTKEADEMTNDYIRNAKQLPKGGRRDATSTIRKLYDHCCSVADEKVNLANQAYELVDGHIRRLDETLARFEADFRSNVSQCVPSNKSSLLSEANSNTSTASTKKRKQESNTPNPKKKTKGESETPGFSKPKKDGSTEGGLPAQSVRSSHWASLMQQATASMDTNVPSGAPGTVSSRDVVMDSVLDMPVDPNEPTYCICHHVSYGEMIGCDNPDCPIEWFHFGCMGLTEQPTGEWFCPRCAPLMSQSDITRSTETGRKRKAPIASKK